MCVINRSMVMAKAKMAGMELANVIEAQVYGHRPITLVGYSMVCVSVCVVTSTPACR
jgi:hypothetical protein